MRCSACPIILTCQAGVKTPGAYQCTCGVIMVQILKGTYEARLYFKCTRKALGVQKTQQGWACHVCITGEEMSPALFPQLRLQRLPQK